MPRPSWSGRLNMDLVDLKRRFMGWIGTLKGEYEVTIEPKREVRTTQQLRWWFPCVVAPFFDFLKDQEWDVNHLQDAHDIIRDKFLRVPTAVHPESGEALAWRTKHTSELTPAEFSAFAEKARGWLSDQFGIVTLDPEQI